MNRMRLTKAQVKRFRRLHDGNAVIANAFFCWQMTELGLCCPTRLFLCTHEANGSTCHVPRIQDHTSSDDKHATVLCNRFGLLDGVGGFRPSSERVPNAKGKTH